MSAPALVCCAGQNGNELYEACIQPWPSGASSTGMAMCEVPGFGKFPVGMIPGEMRGADFGEPANYAGGTRLFRIVVAALEQLARQVEAAVSRYGAENVGVCFGSCDNGSEASLAAHCEFLERNEFPHDYALRFQSVGFPAEAIARRLGVSGPAFTVATACASGASAIARGAELIRSGRCGAVVVGGADVVSQVVFAGFHALEAISDSPTNPFSKNRKGINLGEGAAFFLLDSERLSSIELLGVGESADASHMTAPGGDGMGPARAMKAALLDAGIGGGQIGYVNLHGTGTSLNDKAESLAMREVFGTPLPPSSSTKPITGHTLGAAGALEAAICWMTLNENKGLPVHRWDGEPDDEAPFTPAVAVGAGDEIPAVSICMSNSFAFGGCNVSLVLGRDPR